MRKSWHQVTDTFHNEAEIQNNLTASKQNKEAVKPSSRSVNPL